MPKRDDIESVLVIGSGPIVIGTAPNVVDTGAEGVS